MFDPDVIQHLANKHKRSLQAMSQIEKELNDRFVDFKRPVRALILSVISGEPLLLVGPPGTAKSRLIRAFSGMLDLIDENHPENDHPNYFEYLLTPFTEPGELFGFFDIGKLYNEGILERHKDNVMHKATVVYLDEVFNASSAILNSLLAFLNERIFHDRGKRIKVENLQVLFAATNDPPQTPELRAVFDRFVLRCWVNNVEEKPVQPNHFPSDISRLIQTGWRETYGIVTKISPEIQAYRKEKLLSDLKELQEDIQKLTSQNKCLPQANSEAYLKMAELVKYARGNSRSEMSNRRLIKIAYIFLLLHVYLSVAPDKTKEKGAQSLVELIFYHFFDSFDATVERDMRKFQ